MNTKKSKNKKPNKSPNPIPQQVPENVKVPEKIDDVPTVEKVESEIKIDECVQETISEVISASDIGKEIEVESPKKPKRNRGKKKKQDKDSETEDNQEVKAEPILEEGKNIPIETKSSDVEPIVKPIVSEIQQVTPTARKKKNKNKKDGNQDTTPFVEEKVEENLVIFDISEIEKVNVPLDTVSAVSVKPVEEVKSTKKKNKKKKRHDSEKSDKVEEFSCTSAFQKILNVDDEKSKEVEEKQEILESSISVKDCSKIESATEDKKEEMLKLEEEHAKEEEVALKAGGGKNKKKNKKGKTPKIEDEQQDQSRSESQCEVVCEENPAIQSDVIKPTTDVPTGKIDDSKMSTEDITLETTKTTEEDWAKSKAKIAKPVDKKHKGKREFEDKGGQPEVSSVSDITKVDETENIAKLPTESLPVKEIAFQEVVKPKEISTLEEGKDEAIFTSLVELINIPQSNMGKKRKKSPKPAKSVKETHKEGNQQSITHEIEMSKVEMSIKSEESSAAVESASSIEKQVPSNQQIEPSISDPVIVLKSEPEPRQEILNVPSEITQDVLPVSKPGKKRKKSPKPPSKLEIIESSKPVQETDQTITETKQILEKEPEHTSDEKADIFFDMPHMEDIEIRSVKADESEGSTCEIIPDSIQYPRANSQQQVDDNNNNTLIQEISQTDGTKLTIPIEIPDTPFIQGDVPLTSPEVVLSVGILEKEVPAGKPNEPEKTDLKSKMMEVNQDMEELRLSIEKSLAELTSLEKNEEKIEKHYEKQIQPIDIKTDDTAVLGSDLSVMAMKLEDQTTKLSKENKSISTKLDPKSTTSETVLPASLVLLPMPTDIIKEAESQKEDKKPNIITEDVIPPPPPMPIEIYTKEEEIKLPTTETKSTESSAPSPPPVCPARKDQKGKGKSKKKGKQEAGQTNLQTESTSTSTKEPSKEPKKEQKTESNTQEKGKKHSNVEHINNDDKETQQKEQTLPNFEPIENFEDAMTSSIDDVNKSFEMIANDAQTSDTNVNPEIKIIAPLEETKTEKKDEKVNPVSQPKNLLGHPVIPARSNKMDYKKEKNKTSNALAKVKIKDSIQIEKKQSKESQTDNIQKFMKKKSVDESFSTLMNGNEEFVYKYNFRKVFLPSVCHVCKKDLKQMRVVCCYCNLLFYCSPKHKDEDWPQHQALCFAVSTIVHLKDQKHIYEDAKNVTGHNYRLLRMQMIVSCEKILKRKLVPWEQETLLYPRICSDVGCREWRQHKLLDCDGCGQMAYCSSYPEHLPNSHKRWCKSYSLYQKLVCYQQTKGRLEPKMPSRVITEQYHVPDTINEVLASMYQEKIDMNDVEYAALTQLATAPLTAVYSFQIYNNKMNSIYANGTYKKTSFTIHVVGAELQFEADALNKWELFFLHLRPDIKNLTICLIASNLNPSNLPLDLLEKVRLCEHCRQDKRRLLFSFQDKKTYSEYYKSDDFTAPDMVCAFNPSIQRSTVYNGKDIWPSTITTILKQKIPFTITSYSIEELFRDLGRVKECSQIDFNVISEPKYNSFASVRPDRNFITDDEMPLLFKNYCFAVVCGVF